MAAHPWEDLVVSPRYLEAALDAAPLGDRFVGAPGLLRPATLVDSAGGGYRSAPSSVVTRYVRDRARGGVYVVDFTAVDFAWVAYVEASALASGDEPIPGPEFLISGKVPEPTGAAQGSSAGGILLLLAALGLAWKVLR